MAPKISFLFFFLAFLLIITPSVQGNYYLTLLQPLTSIFLYGGHTKHNYYFQNDINKITDSS